MARQVDIETGVEKAATALERRQRAEMSHQWRELRNKLDTLLLSTNVMKTNEIRQECLKLDTMDTEQRRVHIKQRWGPVYLERAEPMLIQLEALEKHIAQHEK
jgi:hypothetical protein